MSSEDNKECAKGTGVTMYPYMYFKGNCSAAMDFYCEHLGANVECKMPFSKGPPVADEQKDWIMHAVLKFHGNTVMMSDVISDKGGEVVVGNNLTINLNWEDIPAMTKAFEGMSAEGKVLLPLKHQFWGATYGKFVDKFDMSWSFNSAHEGPEAKKQRTD